MVPGISADQGKEQGYGYIVVLSYSFFSFSFWTAGANLAHRKAVTWA